LTLTDVDKRYTPLVKYIGLKLLKQIQTMVLEGETEDFHSKNRRIWDI